MTRSAVRRAALAASLVLVCTAAGSAAPASGRGTPERGAPEQSGANPWLQRRFLNMAHSGGENEAPKNTMYAFKRAVALGADMIELDVQSTVDNRLVVLHNASVDETTDGTGLVRDLTFRQVHALDAAYHFVPGRNAVPDLPPESYPLRGVRTRDRKPPRGYRAADFAVPSLRQVLRAFPDVPINIEIKGTSDTDVESFLHNAKLLARLLKRTHRTDIIVTSFNDRAVAEFHRLAPRVALAPGAEGTTAYVRAGVRPVGGSVALQVPARFNGVPVATPEFVARAHADGYAVHVWFSGTASENEATYNALIDACVDGLMPAWPTALERVLDARGIARPGTPGVDPCAGRR